MHLKRLEIKSIRNIEEARLKELGLINVLYGANGSGKTSVLESIHMLCLGRSFRSRQFRSVIQDGADSAVVFTSALDSQSGRTSSVGVSRSRTASPDIRIDGESVNTLARLAELFPLQLLDADSFELIEGGPAVRRQFLDWGVFHVEHTFIGHWQDVKRCIKHRNSLLRRGKMVRSDLNAWNQQLAVKGEQVDAQRKAYLLEFEALFQPMVSRITGLSGLSLEYARGWPETVGLLEALAGAEEKDLLQCYTSVGPHRADLKIRVNGKAAADVLSRGQEKILVCALRLTQAELLRRMTGKQCMFLVDDLPAELDANYRRTLCAELERLEAQVFVTCIEPGEMATIWSAGQDMKMFHVEHGQIRAITAVTE